MRPYGEGEKRHRAFCWCCWHGTRPRGNRGRNNTARWWLDKKGKTPRLRANTKRYYHGAARQDAKREIARELDLMWLDQELHRAVTRQLGRRRPISHLRYLQEVDVDDYQGYLSDLIERERYDDERYDYCDCCSDRDLWSGDDDPAPTEASWVDLWVDGRVSDPDALDAYNPYYCVYDALHEVYDEVSAYEGLAEQQRQEFDNSIDARLRADSERNTERLRAGERFYKQNKRTVYK